MNYSRYLQLNQLLALQQPASPPSEHRNENLFIITHQTYELWFKQLIDELHCLIDLIENGDIAAANNGLIRINAITKTVVNQIEVIFTLKFHEFQRFRGYLGSASGFQSYQFAGIEALLGKANGKKLQQYGEDPAIQKMLGAIIRPISLWQAVQRHLLLLNDRQGQQAESFKAIIKTVLEEASSESLLLNQLLDLDSLLQEWRYRHVKLVERTIGQRKGTGGSAGSDYLKSTLFTPIFDELWEAIN
ncbi:MULTISPECIES: tryptophan 2,3-dioxygenase family protein [unclassified Serratia (in: enterobacteria)]|uniref:tryptophan 2,3-dioxygenase family protein n=1 Tax=unclassified Serratia (in: enterobacteria) TaxID=2647522 RepID=UPI002ED51DFC|nr:tryptophan 2,3-dioxygenase family protein [Serratia sp. C2(2)]MEE4448327.1 tryptophan 2,3-dioxygenase family protein [Serratia sp. C2(1)]